MYLRVCYRGPKTGKEVLSDITEGMTAGFKTGMRRVGEGRLRANRFSLTRSMTHARASPDQRCTQHHSARSGSCRSCRVARCRVDAQVRCTWCRRCSDQRSSECGSSAFRQLTQGMLTPMEQSQTHAKDSPSNMGARSRDKGLHDLAIEKTVESTCVPRQTPARSTSASASRCER